ncbi:MAG TPA: rod shape-determining protein MreC, partial [Patescibacteria group bacterium]|nr:rod shape-determining protein MreC [Patescibacteria group bacterium]
TAKELIIGEGSEGGVKVGQAVIVGKVILGKITGVQADRSTLRLLTDPSSKVVAVTSSGARGLLVGQFQSFAKLTKVLQEERLDVGELVFTAGEDGWPKGLVIGEVVKVIKKDNELFQEAEIKPQLNYDKLTTVFVILGKQ